MLHLLFGEETTKYFHVNQMNLPVTQPFAVEDLYEKVTNLFTVKYLINKGFWCFEEEIIGIWENPAYKI